MKHIIILTLCAFLGGCDFALSSATVNLTAENIQVYAPDTLFFGEENYFDVSIFNPLDDPLYYDGRDMTLFFAPSGEASDGKLKRAYRRTQQAYAAPKDRILPGDTFDALFGAILLSGHTFDWDPEAFEGGEFVIGVVLYSTPGSEASNYRGLPAPDELSYSEPFTLTFADRE